MKEHLKVRTGVVDGDEFGNEWTVHYTLYEGIDDDGVPCYDLYEGDDQGNGVLVCRSYRLSGVRSMTLRLGELV